jgi:ribosome-binding factor A
MSRVRLDKMNSLILAAANELILLKIKDPRLSGVTVTKAVVSGDLRTVRLFFSLIGDEGRWAEASLAMNKAAGFFRSRLAATLDLRHTPKIVFERDLNLEYAQHINEVLSQLDRPGGDVQDVPEAPGPAGADDLEGD